jgi:anti-sigma regulatory factor (Ser/Thr protein kinase)
MRIVAPESFAHVSDAPTKDVSKDPRSPAFSEPSVDLDLRTVGFIRPAAVVWCAVYQLLGLARGSTCRILVPENMGVCLYLQSVGFFRTAKDAGVEVDDRGIGNRPDPQVVLPLARFSTQREVEDLANLALDNLQRAGLGAANLYPLVTEVFSELALNAVQHSESEIGGLGFIQFYGTAAGRRFICCVGDGGIGIRRSLERNEALRDKLFYDWDAIDLAVQERISGTGEKTRGIGLFGVVEDMRGAGRQLIIHSGIGRLTISEDVERESRRDVLFPGTLAFASIPC